MTERTTKVGPKGQVVIPKRIRDELGIRVGERVSVAREGTDVRVRRILDIEEIQGIFAGEGGTKDLEREHRDELERERRRAEEQP